jgi:hypothetical protein
MSDHLYLLVTGSPVAGFKFIGPFACLNTQKPTCRTTGFLQAYCGLMLKP